MAWRIEEKRGQRKLFPENKRRNEGIVTFTSKTRVGLYEEIDRFIKEKKVEYLSDREIRLVPWYGPPPVYDVGQGPESQWVLEMYAMGYVKD